VSFDSWKTPVNQEKDEKWCSQILHISFSQKDSLNVSVRD